MSQAYQKPNTPSDTLQKWASAADGTLSSRTNGTSEPQTRATSGQNTASQPSNPQLQAARRRHLSRPRRPQVKRAETTRGERNGASSRESHLPIIWVGMSERRRSILCILDICICIIGRCICTTKIAWDNVASCAWNCTGTVTEYLDPSASGSLHLGLEWEKKRTKEYFGYLG